MRFFGATPELLRDIFTTTAIAPDETAQVAADKDNVVKPLPGKAAFKKRTENRIRARVLAGIGENLRNSRAMMAVDLAADGLPIQKETVPLMLWACGKINVQNLHASLKQELGEGGCSRFFEKTDQDDVLKVNSVRISETPVDLVKSYLTRRHAAMDALWDNLWPLFKYDPRGVDDVTELRADALTQRVDMMAEDYNYRHFWSQCRRQMLLYGFSMAFVRSAWDKQTGWRMKPNNTGADPKQVEDIESYTAREGVDFVNPHPSRIFYDIASPLANINTDTGPRYVGYWDIVPFGDLVDPSANFFNLKETFTTNGWIDLTTKYAAFFGYYFNPTVMKFPDLGDGAEISALANDRNARVGKYSTEAKDVGCLLTQYFEKINPKQEGICAYDCDVWMRLTVAGDCTVIGGEFLPSGPGCYGAVNWNDGRAANQSMGMQLLSYQDQASNIVTQMIQQLRMSMQQLVLIDEDSLSADTVKELKKSAQNKDWWIDPKIFIYSATKLKDIGILDPRQAFAIVQPQLSQALDGGLKMLSQLLNLADRLLILSPNELGQPNPREVSAREVQEVSTSVQSIYSFINQGPREQIATAKRVIYESLIGCATQSFTVPALKRYTRAVVEAAGFKVSGNVKPKTGKDGLPVAPEDDVLPIQVPVMGNLRDLVYNYYFDSRDGAERAVSAQGAQVVQQLLGNMLKVPGVAQKMGWNDIAGGLNVVLRMSGAPWNFQFQTTVGGDDTMPDSNPQDPQTAQGLQAISQQVQKIEMILAQVLHVPASAFQAGAPAGQPGQPPAGAQPGAAPAPGAPPPGQPPPAAAPAATGPSLQEPQAA